MGNRQFFLIIAVAAVSLVSIICQAVNAVGEVSVVINEIYSFSGPLSQRVFFCQESIYGCPHTFYGTAKGTGEIKKLERV